MFIFN